MICQHDRPTVGLARNDRADGVLAQRDARATARQCGARPLRIARGISAFAIFAIFLALHRTDGASACWKKQVKIDDGPERLVPSQGGTNGSNPTCSSGESRELPYRDAHRSQGPSTDNSGQTPDCRAATNPNPQSPLRDSHAAAIMPMPRRRIPILIVAVFPSRSPRYSRSDSGRFPSASCCCSPALSLIGLRGERGSRSFSQAKEPRPNCSVGTCSSY